MDLEINQPVRIANVDALRSKYHADGGRFVVSLSCVSLIVISFIKPRIRWIPPRRSPHWGGLAWSVSSLFLGWWSVGGLINTQLVLAHNLLGGFDITSVIVDPRTKDGLYFWERMDIGRSFQQRRFTLFLVMLLVSILFVAPVLLIGILHLTGV